MFKTKCELQKSDLLQIPTFNIKICVCVCVSNRLCSRYIFNKAFVMIFCCYKIKYDTMLRMSTNVTVFSPAPSTF